MGQGNSDIIYFLEQHEQEIINCCRKGMSNNEVRELLKTKLEAGFLNQEIVRLLSNLRRTKSILIFLIIKLNFLYLHFY